MCQVHKEFMKEAIELSCKNVDNGGGPFGAVIVKNGKVISRGVNKVTICNDPTAHAEVNAIRDAAAELKTFDLSGCVIYSSCEPCPMCLAAIYWAHIDRIYFGNSKTDASEINFDDAFIYEEIMLSGEKRKLSSIQIMRDEALEVFKKWSSKEDKIEY